MLQTVALCNDQVLWVRFSERDYRITSAIDDLLRRTFALTPEVTVEFNGMASVRIGRSRSGNTFGLEVSASPQLWLPFYGEIEQVLGLVTGFVIGACLYADEHNEVYSAIQGLCNAYTQHP